MTETLTLALLIILGVWVIIVDVLHVARGGGIGDTHLGGLVHIALVALFLCGVLVVLVLGAAGFLVVFVLAAIADVCIAMWRRIRRGARSVRDRRDTGAANEY